MSIKALINPEMLLWVRENSGYSIEDISKKTKIKSERLRNWEKGQEYPTINQLSKLSNIYKRPMLIFYLEKKPDNEKILTDFRTNTIEDEFHKDNPKIKIEIRKALERRQIALDLIDEIEEKIINFNYKISIHDNIIEQANFIRNILQINHIKQSRWKDNYEAFNYWCIAIENTGVLIFQATNIDITCMRGFSICKFPLPIIVLNSKDAIRGRIFTLLHEFVHVLLHTDGICNLSSEEEKEIEVFCNNMAGEILVPQDILKHNDIVVNNSENKYWSDEQLTKLANIFNVSEEVILRRLLICNLTTNDFYRKKHLEFKQKYIMLSKEKKDVIVPYYKKAISYAGIKFTNLVLQSYYQEKINMSDFSNYLNVKIKNIQDIQQSIFSKLSKADFVNV